MTRVLQRIERLLAIMQKETYQIMRDPSALLVAFVLPVIMLFIFGYALSLDVERVKIGVVMEDRAPISRKLWDFLNASRYFDATFYDSRAQAEAALVNATKRAALIVPNDFSKRIERGETPEVQLLLDGCEPNMALIIENYVRGVFQKYLSALQAETQTVNVNALNATQIQSRLRFNVAQITRNSLIPGSIALVLAMIGTLLTAMIVAREWERGTMEATLSTSIGLFEMVLGKLLPYFALGIVTSLLCLGIARFVMGTPVEGSLCAYLASTSAFLFVTTSQGLLISSVCRNQTRASQVALLVSFLPNFILSGVLFEISAMPEALQILTYFFPARYYVVCIQTVCMAGDLWTLLANQIQYIMLIGVVSFVATLVATPKRLI